MKGGKDKEMIEDENELESYNITKKLNLNVIQEIVAVEKEQGLNAENLLEKAKNPNSSMHDFFEWDDSEAGNLWRLHQARMLINEVKIIVGEKSLYAFENVQIETEDGTTRMYKTQAEIVSNVDLRNQLLKRAFEQIKYWQQQYSNYYEFNLIFNSIKKTEKNLSKKWQKKKAIKATNNLQFKKQKPLILSH